MISQSLVRSNVLKLVPIYSTISYSARPFSSTKNFTSSSYIYDPFSTFTNNSLLDQLSQLNTLRSSQINIDENEMTKEKYAEPLIGEENKPESEGEKVWRMINTFTRKQLKMKKHKRVKRKKLLKNLLKQSGKI